MSAPPSIAIGESLPPMPAASLVAAFADIARRHPAHVAVIDGDRRLDYAALDRASDALANALAAAGVVRGDRVGSRLERSADNIVATLAILKCAATCVPFDPAAPAQRHALQAANAVLRALVVAVDDQAPDWFAGPVLRPRPAANAARDAHVACMHDAPGPDDIAYVIHTSGSTGEPKGVRLTHRGLVDLFRGADYARIAAGDVVHHGMSVAFDGALFEIWLALTHGAAISVLPPGASATALCDLVERTGTTMILLTTGLFNTLTDDALRRLARVRTVMVGGDVLAPAAAARFLAHGGDSLVNGYGPTEVSVFSHVHVLRRGDAVDGAIPIGRPLPGMRAYVLDEARRPVPVGVEGEAWIGGSGVAQGYQAQPALTEERFLPDPFAGGEARMYRSGDLVRQRADGALEYVGRIDAQVKINGFRVELGEIEHALCALDDLVAACAVHAKNAAGFSQLQAFAVRGPAATLDADALLARLPERLPGYMVPRRLRFLDALPLTLNGKVDRRALIALIDAGTDAADSATAERDDVENSADAIETRALLALLAECVGAARVDAEDNFYAIGGDSLSAMRFCALIEQTRGVDLPMTALFEADALGEVIDRIADATRAVADGCPERGIA